MNRTLLLAAFLLAVPALALAQEGADQKTIDKGVVVTPQGVAAQPVFVTNPPEAWSLLGWEISASTVLLVFLLIIVVLLALNIAQLASLRAALEQRK